MGAEACERIAELLGEMGPPAGSSMMEVLDWKPDPELKARALSELSEELGDTTYILRRACEHLATEWEPLSRSELSKEEKLRLRAEAVGFVLHARGGVVRPKELGWELYLHHTDDVPEHVERFLQHRRRHTNKV